MIKCFANPLLAKKTLVEEQVAFDLRVGNFDSDWVARTQICASKNRSCVTACKKVFNYVVIELASGLG
jgi:hypothetical protein